MNTKTCSKCKLTLPLNDFYIKYRNPIRYYSTCKKCHNLWVSTHSKETGYRREHYLKNKDKYIQKANNFASNPLNRTKIQEYKKKSAEKLKFSRNERIRNKRKETRKAFLEMYGGRCSCCGETIEEFLTIEHINGQKGIKRVHKKSGSHAYLDAIREYRPDLYTILCWNCNCSKGRYGYCPHAGLPKERVTIK